MLNTLLDATREKPERGVVTLIGPPQEGKNHAGYEYARSRSLPALTWNVAGDPEEEMGGHPLKDEHKREVVYSDPVAITTLKRKYGLSDTDPYLLILDELDKARRDNLTNLLSLLNPEQRAIRHYTLPVGSVILCLMNEPQTPMLEPLLARLLIVDWPRSQEARIGALPGTVRYIAQVVLKPITVKFPARPLTSGSLFKLEAWFDLPAFWTDDELKKVVVRGLFPEQATSEILAKLTEAAPVGDAVAWVRKVRPQTLADKLIGVLSSIESREERHQVLTALCEREKNDETGEIKRFWKVFLSTPDAAGLVGMDAAGQEKGRLALMKALSESK